MAENPPFAFQAAKASWMAPLVAIALGIAGNSMLQSGSNLGEEGADTIRTGKIIMALIAFAIVLVGVVFGVIALFGIKKHGGKGILLPSIIGLLLSGGYLYLVVSTLLLVQRIVQERGLTPH
jgi:hypothetical protein